MRPIGLSCAGAALVVTGLAAQQELFPHADLDPRFSTLQLSFLAAALLGFGITVLRRPRWASAWELGLVLATLVLVFLILEDRNQALLAAAIAAPLLLALYWKREQVRRHRPELLLSYTMFLLCFIVFEAAARVYYFGPRALLPQYGSSVNELGKSGLLRKSDDPEIQWEFKPNLDEIYNLVRFQTNSRGLPDKEYPLAKPEATYRVAVIGDSVTQPFGVALENSFHTILEHRYDALSELKSGSESELESELESESIRHEFINFAVGGYSLPQYLAVLKGRALAYQPDHLLLAIYPGNDLYLEDRRNFKIQRKRTNQYLKLWSTRLFSRHLIKRIEAMRRPTEKPPDYDVGAIRQIFREIHQIVAAERIGMTSIVLRRGPDLHRREFEIIRDVSRDLEIPLIDTGPAFTSVAFRDTVVSQMDPHPNVQAHEIFAATIYGALELGF